MPSSSRPDRRYPRTYEDETIEHDRCQWGRQWSPIEIAEVFYAHEVDDWNAITGVACILGESGGWEWIRPLVVNPTDMRFHLSVDRGICQWNSVAWGPVLLSDPSTLNPQWITDEVAYTAPLAIAKMIDVARVPGSWRFDYASHWHAAKPDRDTKIRPLDEHIPLAREAVNVVRMENGLDPV